MTDVRALASDCPVRRARVLACLERTSSAISARVCSGCTGFPFLRRGSCFDCNTLYKKQPHSSDQDPPGTPATKRPIAPYYASAQGANPQRSWAFGPGQRVLSENNPMEETLCAL